MRYVGRYPPLKRQSLGLRTGLLLAIAAIFLLLMANFQSLRLPLAILSTIPGVLCGVVLMLLFTGTTLNIQSFMGAIMAVGISVANSILLVSFAEQARHQNEDVETATRTGATSRIRAILMTATAMICGMIAHGNWYWRRKRAVGSSRSGGDRWTHLLHVDDSHGPPGRLCAATTQSVHHVEFTQSRRPIESILCPSINASAFCFRWCAVLPAFSQSPAHVEMVKVESRSSARTVPLTAELAPFLQTDIEARSPGYVEKVLVDRGSLVHRGQLLVQLSAPEINSQTSASEANLHQAEAEVAQAEAQAAAAESTAAKLQEAAKTPGAVAGNELLQAQKQRDAAQALVDSRKAAVTNCERPSPGKPGDGVLSPRDRAVRWNDYRPIC